MQYESRWQWEREQRRVTAARRQHALLRNTRRRAWILFLGGLALGIPLGMLCQAAFHL